jgi:peptidyl-tRNA hydrolase, PTH1 family
MLFVGLGNPDQKYVYTRHNVGRDILLEIIKSGHFSELQKDTYANALISEELIDDEGTKKEKTVITLPNTYMNRSGESVKELIKKHNLDSGSVVLVHDDIDLSFGRIKISKDRGDGGHNGVKSVVEHLGTRDFSRIRIGVCPVNEEGEKIKPHKDVVSRYVLGQFSPKEIEGLKSITKRVKEALALMAEVGVERAMNTINEA